MSSWNLLLFNPCHNYSWFHYFDLLRPLICGVPQGSVLGIVDLFFTIYVRNFCHGCAHDKQLYFSIKPSNFSSLSYLSECFTAITNLMPSNFLHLNSGKTEILVLGHEIFSSEVSHYTSPPANSIKYSTENLLHLFLFCFIL